MHRAFPRILQRWLGLLKDDEIMCDCGRFILKSEKSGFTFYGLDEPLVHTARLCAPERETV